MQVTSCLHLNVRGGGQFWLTGVLDSYYLTCVPEAVTIEGSSSIAVSLVALGPLFAYFFPILVDFIVLWLWKCSLTFLMVMVYRYISERYFLSLFTNETMSRS